MKTPTIRALGISVIAATLITGVIYVASSYKIRNEIQDSRTIWNNYQRISANRAQSLSSLIRNMGFGGMIHHFKEFIVKGDEDLSQQRHAQRWRCPRRDGTISGISHQCSRTRGPATPSALTIMNLYESHLYCG